MYNPRKYKSPVDQLLRLGSEPGNEEEEFDYLELGFSEKDIPQLIELATDHDLLFPEDEDEFEEDDPRLYGPVHAWRALGQMQAAEAVEPLLTLLAQEDDCIEEEIPTVLAMIGEPSIEPLREYIRQNLDLDLGIDMAIDCLQEIAVEDPELADHCISVLEDFLENYEENDETFNALLINGLAELHAEDAKPLIEQAFNGGHVDESIIDREEVEVMMNETSPENAEEMMKSLGKVLPPEFMQMLKQPGAMDELKKMSRQLKRDMLRASEDDDIGPEDDVITEEDILDFFDKDIEEEEPDSGRQPNGKQSKSKKTKKKK